MASARALRCQPAGHLSFEHVSLRRWRQRGDRRQQRLHIPAPDARGRCVDLAEDPALARNAGRVARRRIDAAIADWTGAHDSAQGLAALDAALVRAGSIYTAADIAADPHDARAT